MFYFLTLLFLVQGGPNKPATTPGPGHRIVEYLNLTESQKKEWDRIHIKFQKDINELNYKIRNKEIELREITLSDEVDLKKLKKKMEEIARLKYEISLKRIDMQLSIYKLLNEEQRKEFLQFLLGYGKGHHRRPHKMRRR